MLCTDFTVAILLLEYIVLNPVNIMCPFRWFGIKDSTFSKYAFSSINSLSNSDLSANSSISSFNLSMLIIIIRILCFSRDTYTYRPNIMKLILTLYFEYTFSFFTNVFNLFLPFFPNTLVTTSDTTVTRQIRLKKQYIIQVKTNQILSNSYSHRHIVDALKLYNKIIKYLKWNIFFIDIKL